MAQFEYGAYLDLKNAYQFAKFANGNIEAKMSICPIHLMQPTVGAGSGSGARGEVGVGTRRCRVQGTAPLCPNSAPTENIIMKYDPQKHHRRSIRLKGYDYTQAGAYFVTICTYQRMYVFGEVINGEMVLNETGKIARDEWFKTGELRPYVRLYENEFVVMPNHAHGVIWIVDNVGTRRGRVHDWVEQRAGQRPAPTAESFGKPVKGSIPTIVRAYKSAVTYAVNGAQNMRGAVLWQKNYYEHVIRNDRELKNIGWYILNNPLNWQLDRDNLQNIRKLSPPEKVEEYVKDVEEMVLKLKADPQ
jgi:REP element-mobilizing transposase RayT